MPAVLYNVVCGVIRMLTFRSVMIVTLRILCSSYVMSVLIVKISYCFEVAQ